MWPELGIGEAGSRQTEIMLITRRLIRVCNLLCPVAGRRVFKSVLVWPA